MNRVCRSVDAEEVARLVGGWELVTVEFKSRRFLTDWGREAARNLAAQLVSLSNRDGGRIVFGVDDKTRAIEQGPFNEKHVCVERVAHVARDLCSPPPDLAHEFVECPEGEVLVVSVGRRAGMPLAVVERRGAEIRGRTYYIRNNQGKQLVTDNELLQIFVNKDFPKIRASFPFVYPYNRASLAEAESTEYPSRVVANLVFIFGLPKASPVSGQDSEFVPRLLAELFPYAIIGSLARNFSAGWGWEVQVSGSALVGKSTNQPAVKFRAENLPGPPAGSLLGGASPQFTDFSRTAFLLASELSLPPGSEISVEYPEPQGNSRLVIGAAETYRLTVAYRGGEWSVGLPAGHPLDTADGPRILRSDNPYATAYATVDVEFEVLFGSQFARQLGDYYDWGRRMLKILEADLSWFKYMDRLPAPFLRRIDRKLDSILGKLT